MSKWKYDGYTKDKIGSKFIEKWIYVCPYCKDEVRIKAMTKPPLNCPRCGADMRGDNE